MARHADQNWKLPDQTTPENVHLALLMDLRDELKAIKAEMKRLNSVMYCPNTRAIPRILRRISANTAKPRRVK